VVTRRAALAALLGASACSWSAFDDLANQTWVDSVGAADGVDPAELIGVAAPGQTAQTAVFVVLGRAEDSLGSFRYAVDGTRTSQGVVIHAGATQLGPLPRGVPMVGDPYSNHVGVAAVTGEDGAGATKIVHFRADDVGMIQQSDFSDPGTPPSLAGAIMPTAMAYARSDDDGDGTETTDVVLARGDHVALVRDYQAASYALVGCRPGGVVQAVGAGRFVAGRAADQILVITSTAEGGSQLHLLDGSTIVAAHDGRELAPCFDGGRVPLASFPGPAGDASFGEGLVVADFDGDGLLDFAVASPDRDRVYVFHHDGDLADGLTAVEVPVPPDASRFGAALIAADLDGSGGAELVIGAPGANLRGERNAGAVYVYGWSGSQMTLQRTLHDAQPEAEQRFGSGVAVVPWGGSQRVLVVAADREVYTYFRLDPLYADVRQ
jgi:hypothetical protein